MFEIEQENNLHSPYYRYNLLNNICIYLVFK